MRFRARLVPLMFDPEAAVAREAIRSAGQGGGPEDLLVPPLVSLLRQRSLHDAARDVLVGRGEEVVEALGHFLAEEAEDVEVRRRIPATLARIPSQRSVDLLLASLGQEDEILRDEALAALERLRREHAALVFARGPVEERALAEARQALRCLSLRFNLLRDDGQGSLLDRALEERRERSVDRVYRLLGLVFPWRDVAVARWGMEGDARAHARASEYLDNMLAGPLRRWLMPLLEEAPARGEGREGERAAADPGARPRGHAGSARSTTKRRRSPPPPSTASRRRGCGGWPTTWSTCSSTAQPATSWFSRRRRGRSPRSGCPPRRAARAGARRCPPWWRRSDCAECRSSGSPRWGSFSASPARAGRCGRSPGSCLYREGAFATQVQLLLEGPVAVQAGDAPAGERSAPQALGLEAVLAGERQRETVWAGEGAVCLTVGARDLLGLLAEDSALVRRIFRAVLEDSVADGGVLRPRRPVEAPGVAGAQTLEAVHVLGASPLFARATPDQLLRLAQIAREVPLAPGLDAVRRGGSGCALRGGER